MHSLAATTSDVTEHPAPSPQSDSTNSTVARQRWRVSASVGAAAFLLYLFCLSSTVTYTGDCGELIAASYRLGIAHPSGYPLYCMLGRLFATLVPLGEVGWRYNLLSAVLGAIMVGFMAATVHRLTINPHSAPAGESLPKPSSVLLYDQWPAIGTGLLLAGFYFVGSQCVIAEVSTLEGINECALFYCAVAWHQDKDWRWVYTGALVCGLAIVAHLTSVFMLPGLLIYVVWQHRARFKSLVTSLDTPAMPAISSASTAAKSLVWRRSVVICALPCLIYALTVYFPLRSRLYPEPSPPRAWAPLDWTHPVDFGRWRTHVTAQQYRIHLVQPTAVALAGHTVTIPWFVKPMSAVPGDLEALFIFVLDSYLWFTPLILVGAVVSLRDGPLNTAPRTGGRWLGAALLAIFLLNVGVEVHYDVSDQSNFFFPAYMVMAIWLGLGLAAMLRAIATWSEQLALRKGEPLWQWRLGTLAWLMVLGTVAVEWNIYVGVSSFRGVTSARDAALERAEAADQLAKQSTATPILLLMEDDSLWGFWYAHYVLNRGERVRTPWGPLRNQIAADQHLVDFVAQLEGEGPVAINQFNDDVDKRFPYVPLTPSGNLWLTTHRALPMPATPISGTATHGIPGPSGIINAQFRRTTLTKEQGGNLGEVLEGLAPSAKGNLQRILQRVGLCVLKRDDMAILDVDFVTSPAMQQQLAHAPVDATHKAAQVGWVQVLMVRRGFQKGTPAPGPHENRVKSDLTPPLMAWTQKRRLIVPINMHSGMPLHAVLPIQIDGDSVSSLYDVWTRLFTTPNDRTTPWQHTDVVRLTVT